MSDVPSGVFATRWSSQILSYCVRPIWQKVLRFERKTGLCGPMKRLKPARRGRSSAPVGQAVHQKRTQEGRIEADLAVRIPGYRELGGEPGQRVDDGGAQRAVGHDHRDL